MEITKRNLCVGCSVCAHVCPEGAIVMKEDEFGALYPSVDGYRCKGCLLCKRSCPVNNKAKQNPTYKVYAAWALEPEERKSATSGGFASAVSNEIIKSGGVVYGSALTENGIRHIRAGERSSLERLKGSKYVQSPIEDVLNPVLNDLKSGIPVLFTGTPCQTAAVLSFLGRDYDNLYLIDLICTGVPPQKLLWEHLGLMPDALCNISFRGCGGSRLKASGPHGELYKKPYYKDHFLMGFREYLYLRESCYSCPFASNERASDITIGDFWGLGKNEPFKHDITDGVSVVFPHSQKGEELIKMCRDRIFLEERELSEAVLGNPRFNIPSDRHRNYDLFRRCYKRKGFRYAFKKSMRKERFDYFIDGRIESLKRFLKSL